MKNIKKIFAALLVLAMAFAFTACAQNGSTTTSTATLSTTSGETSTPEASSYDNNLDGLVSYLTDAEVIAGDPVSMEASVIGATAGKKFSYTYEGEKIVTELYEFDLDNLESTAETTLSGIKADGEFTVLDTGVKAMLSDNGKFVMIYTNASEEDVQKTFSEKIQSLFKGFSGK